MKRGQWNDAIDGVSCDIDIHLEEYMEVLEYSDLPCRFVFNTPRTSEDLDATTMNSTIAVESCTTP